MTVESPSVAVLIIAAGASTRLGRPKQLLPYANKPLLHHTLQASLVLTAAPVFVVLGANARAIQSEIDFGAAQVVVNEHWQEGMASSIRIGINTLQQQVPVIEGVVILLCDQPYVTAQLINSLISSHRDTGKLIVASCYNGVTGAPAFFHKDLFFELLELRGDTGAKAIIERHKTDLETVGFSRGNIDIDTEADYLQLQKAATPIDQTNG